MHICILETGEPADRLKEQFGGYPAMFKRMLSGLFAEFSFSTTAAHKGEALPAISEFDGLLITGSPAGVYEDHDWITPAETLVRETAEADKPQVGVCFGHQLMAQAFGGKVEKSSRGWGVGVHTYKVNDAAHWMAPMQSHVTCAVSHQDQIIEPPAGAQVLGGSEFCPNSILAYAQGRSISFQPHPEFPHEFAAALIEHRKDVIPGERASQGLESLKGKSDRDLIAQWIANFFLQHER